MTKVNLLSALRLLHLATFQLSLSNKDNFSFHDEWIKTEVIFTINSTLQKPKIVIQLQIQHDVKFQQQIMYL